MGERKTKKMLFFIIVMSGLILCSFGEVIAQTSSSSQTSSPSLIALSASRLNFYGQEVTPVTGQEGAGSISRTINVVGLVNQPTAVTLIPADVSDNSTGAVISYSSMNISPSNFTLSKNELKIVTISINTHGAKIGTYQGMIIVTAATDTSNETYSTIPVTVKIDIWNPVFTRFLLVFLILFFFGVALVIGLAIPKAQKTRLDAARDQARESILAKKAKRISEKELDAQVEKALIDGKFIKEKPGPDKGLRVHVRFNLRNKYLNSPKLWAIVFGLVAIFLWVYLNTGPGMSFTDTGNVFSTGLMIPLAAYLIGLVTGKVGNGSDGSKPKKTGSKK
jgi:hypothetical protein